jgi:hypothetical protein
MGKTKAKTGVKAKPKLTGIKYRLNRVVWGAGVELEDDDSLFPALLKWLDDELERIAIKRGRVKK